MRRIGFLTSSSPVVSIESSYHAGLLRGMRELGYVVGKDFIVEWRFAEGKLERFAEFAAELVRLNVDVFVLGTPTAVPAVRQATSSIPIVMGFSTDPVGNGFIASLARPGGNITGLASSQDDAVPKQMELLTMIVRPFPDRPARRSEQPQFLSHRQECSSCGRERGSHSRTGGSPQSPRSGGCIRHTDQRARRSRHSRGWVRHFLLPRNASRSSRSNIGCRRYSRCASSSRLVG
jgi:hypothetical protein